MQCEVTPARRPPQLALLIVTSLAVMAITGAFAKQQRELDRQADEIRVLKAPKWFGDVAQHADGTASLTGIYGGTITNTEPVMMRLGDAILTDDGSRLCIGRAPQR